MKRTLHLFDITFPGRKTSDRDVASKEESFYTRSGKSNLRTEQIIEEIDNVGIRQKFCFQSSR